MKKLVMLGFIILLSFNFVESDSINWCFCEEPGCPTIFWHLGPNYCFTDSDCTQTFRRFPQLGYGTYRLGVGEAGPSLGDPEYTFQAPNSCSTPGGCAEPYILDPNDDYGRITIPANTYDIQDYVFFGFWQACEPMGEVFGINWQYVRPFGELAMFTTQCNTDSDCHVITERQFREFHGDVAVRLTQDSTVWYEDTLAPSSIEIYNFEGYGYITFDVPSNTFGPGEVYMQVYDLIWEVPISEQSGGYTVLDFVGPPVTLQIDVTPETCWTHLDCDIEIDVLNVPIDLVNQNFGFSGVWNDGPIDLNDPGVAVGGNTVYYTIPSGTIGSAGTLNVHYQDEDLYQEDMDTINIVLPTCVPDGCSGICPPGCTIVEDEDCACQDDDGCCGIGCDDGNDNDCLPTCVPDATCDGICNPGCTVVEDLDCGCQDGDGCCGIACTHMNDDDCPISLFCGDGVITPPEVCDCGFDGVCDASELGGEDCTTIGMGYDGGTLDCAIGCLAFNVGGCTYSGGGPGPGPVAGPDEYIVYGLCSDDGDGDEYGEMNWTMYANSGLSIDNGFTGCVLDIEDASGFSIVSFLMFIGTLFGFYFYNKKIFK